MAMQNSRTIFNPIIQYVPRRQIGASQRRPWFCQQCFYRRQHRLGPSAFFRRAQQQRRHQTNPADSPDFHSVLDNPPVLVRSGRKHNYWGIAFLATIPITAFVLGCWQVQRLGWKTDLIAKFEDRLIREPLPLPPRIDPNAIEAFDYRRVYAKGKLRHDQEMLIGPRLHDGDDGYLVVTPLDRSSQFPGFEGNTNVLVNRGWIPKSKARQHTRPEGLPQGEVVVEGLLREPWKKNMFTPDNHPNENAWYFPDVHEMAEHTGSQAVWIEETMNDDLLETYRRSDLGIPIGRPPEVNLRNNHTQYIFTWFSLSLATSIMLWMVVKRPPGGGRARIRRNTSW